MIDLPFQLNEFTRLKYFRFIKYLVIIIAAALPARAQQSMGIFVSDTIQINLENTYHISSPSIIPFTEEISLKNKIIDKKYIDFNYSQGYFSLSDSLKYSLFDTLIVTYHSLNLSLQKEYKRRTLVKVYDEVTNTTIRSVREQSVNLSSESIFGSDIRSTGTIVRGFTLGTNRDLNVNSGLRLQLSGRLSDDIEIVAALTDENTPIQPEGNTETLEELDKVFIEVRHPNAIGTFGDYDYTERIGEFGKIDRKLQGLKGEFFYEDNQLKSAVASSRGKYNSNQFNGIDGVQGPYRLSGINNEREIIIIAGSEKVFVDGQEMRRGENNDYTIEYANAQITFTANRLITSASRITVDFEYTDRQYQRNFFAGSGSTALFNNRLKIAVSYAQEGDDENSPIDFILSEEDKEILENAGDDRNKAVRDGASLALPDSNGIIKGIYTKIDTTINNEPFSYYQYNPGDPSSLYNVIFSFVGEGVGDYRKESIGRYTFVGKGNGGYLPIRYIPIPELRQVGNFLITAEPFDDLILNLELAGSLYDRNRLSAVDDTDNGGYARNIELKLNPKKIEVGDLSLGKIGFSYKDRFKQDKYESIDRIDNVEFNRDYNLTDQTRVNEELREIGINLIPVDELNVRSKYGFLKRGNIFESNRYLTNVSLTKQDAYNFIYDFDYVDSKNRLIKTNWFRQKGDLSYLINFIKPGFQFETENKKDNTSSKDSLLSSSLSFNEYAPYLQLVDLGGLNLTAKYSLREESYPIQGKLVKESLAKTQNYQVDYSGIKEVNTTLSITLRKKEFTDEFKDQNRLDNETVLIRSQSRFNFWDRFIQSDLFYETTTQRSARLERVFVKVEQGTGNYIYLGDLNNNGIADEDEFEQTIFDGDYILTTIPTDELFPVIDLKTSTRWKLDFARLFDKDYSLLGTLIKPIFTETFWRVEENSRLEDTKQIYLLNFSKFLNDSTTVRGSNLFQQDVYLFRNSSELSFRFRFTQRRNLNQFSGGTERGFFNEQALRINFKMVEEINNQTEIITQNDNVASKARNNRAREVNTTEVKTDFSYRPIRNLEVGFIIGAGRSEDTFPDEPTIIDLNSQGLRVTYSFAGKGRIRAEVERKELNANTTENYIPFEVTKGNTLGKNYYWRLNFDYRIANNLQTTFSYDGRLQGAGKVINTMRAEARAYF